MSTLPAGLVFADRYKIIELIGRGGMGEVYRAFHVELRKQVALKVFRSAATRLPSDLQIAQRFEREAHTLAKLDHRGCVRILDHGRLGRYQYLAMDLVEGRDLATILRDDGPLSPERATRIARDILAALAHAHEQGVLHRDLKPANVMVADADGRVVVIDFGLARQEDDAALTARGTCFGSPSYLAPERLAGAAYDERADLYSVGVILYELLAGVRPFPGDTMVEIVQRAAAGPPHPLRAHRPTVTRALELVVMRAMARDPARRHADAAEMRAALAEPPRTDDAAASSTNLALVPPPSVVRRVWSWLRYGAWRWT